MRFERHEDRIIITPDQGETQEQVLRAIAKAAFEDSFAVGMGVMHYDPDHVLTDEQADRFMQDSETAALNMRYVQGRQVKISVYAAEDDQLVIYLAEYERDHRATPDSMLNRAQEILAGDEPKGHIPYGYRFKGRNLDLFLVELGFERKPGESDWNFRKRIFPELWQQSRDNALMVLFGGYPLTDFNEIDQLLAMDLMMRNPGPAELAKFADGFAGDPLAHREKYPAAA